MGQRVAQEGVSSSDCSEGVQYNKGLGLSRTSMAFDSAWGLYDGQMRCILTRRARSCPMTTSSTSVTPG